MHAPMSAPMSAPKTAVNFFNLSMRRAYCLLMPTAADTVEDVLPVKCMEAVLLALLLTSS